MSRIITHKVKVDFLERYRLMFGGFFDCAMDDKDVCKPCRKDIVEAARKSLGFSKKTAAVDIFSSLKIAWKRRV